MLRKLFSFIVVLAVIVALSGIFIHLYNNSNKASHKFDVLKEETKKNINKSSKKKSTKKEDNNKDNKKNVELDDNEISDTDEDNKENNDSSANNTVGNEVAVASTGSNRNVYISIIGGIIIISGMSVIIFKFN